MPDSPKDGAAAPKRTVTDKGADAEAPAADTRDTDPQPAPLSRPELEHLRRELQRKFH